MLEPDDELRERDAAAFEKLRRAVSGALVVPEDLPVAEDEVEVLIWGEEAGKEIGCVRVRRGDVIG